MSSAIYPDPPRLVTAVCGHGEQQRLSNARLRANVAPSVRHNARSPIAGSFLGGFRTPATVPLASPAWPASETLHTNGPEQLQQILPARPAPLRVKHITIHHIVAGCCFRIGKGDNPLPARINSGIDYMKRCECITILGGVAGRGKGAIGGSVGDRAHRNLARATAYYRRWPTSRPCLLAFRFTAATVLLIDLAIVVTGVFLRKWLFNSRKSSFVHLRTGTLLLAGAGFFIIWHVLGMCLRAYGLGAIRRMSGAFL